MQSLLSLSKWKIMFIILLSFILIFSIIAPTASAYTLGDVNDDGRIDVRDVVLLMRYVLGHETLTIEQQKAADVNKDGVIDVRDATLITQHIFSIPFIEYELKAHFVGVGQGDAIFLQTNYQQWDPSNIIISQGVVQNILIDGGDRGDTVVNYLEDLDVDKLDLVIGTHPHADRIGGLINVMETIEVEEIIDPGVTHTTITFEDYLDIIDEKDITYTEGRAGMERDLGGGAEMEIIHPVTPSSAHLNNASIVARVTFGDISFMFTGDAEQEAEAEMLDRDYILESTILKVGHHGSNTSTTDDFLSAVNPEIAIIMCGEGNVYGHPHEETLDKLSEANVDIYRTDLQGTIIVTTDGTTYEINTDPYEHDYEPSEPGDNEHETDPENEEDEEQYEDKNDEEKETEPDPVNGAEHPILPSEPLYLYAEDGTYLGKLTTNQYDPDSIFNQFGTYGSRFSSTSIWNDYGQYGGDFSSQSPFNDFTSTPPYIVTADGEVVGRLTTNRFITGAVCPYEIEDILLELGL